MPGMKLRRSVKAVQTKYWMPGSNYLKIIASALRDKINDGDIVLVSEKALAVAKGLIVDEGHVKPGILAKILARFWMRIIWGFFLGRICRLKEENIQNIAIFQQIAQELQSNFEKIRQNSVNNASSVRAESVNYSSTTEPEGRQSQEVTQNQGDTKN